MMGRLGRTDTAMSTKVADCLPFQRLESPQSSHLGATSPLGRLPVFGISAEIGISKELEDSKPASGQ